MKKYTLQDLDYGKKTHKQGKWENHMVGPGIWQDTLKKVKNEKCTLQDRNYGENLEKREKRETDTVRTGIWREN